MLARVFSCAVIGLEGVVVEVEVDTGDGLPSVIIVGLPDAAVQESRERVQSAIKNAGMFFPRKRLTVNLAPAAVRKEGPAYDLPIALGALIASGQLPYECVDGSMVVGELSLDGSVRHVRGVLPMAALARAAGLSAHLYPAFRCTRSGPDPRPGSDSGAHPHRPGCAPVRRAADPPQPPVQPEDLPVYVQTDFAEVKGQEHVKRALEVAAAGMHNVLMVGPPGAGKTLLARAIPSILPRMTIDEALDVTRIYSVADQLPPDVPLIRNRPFRSPHHTISHAGLVGGGNLPHPGEISLAHRGVLFLDELPEFGMRVLEVLRQPIEDKVVTISRAQGTLTFPANFMMIGAMNPCPCGYYGDPVKPCTCSKPSSPSTRSASPARCWTASTSTSKCRVSNTTSSATAAWASLRPRSRRGSRRPASASASGSRCVQRIRKMGRIARAPSPATPTCARRRCASICTLDEASRSLMKTAMSQLNLSARAYHRVLKLARTIADLAGSESIQTAHLAEALQYRPRLMEGRVGETVRIIF